jgi:hypothetical protein
MGAVWFMPKLSMRRRPEPRESNVPRLRQHSSWVAAFNSVVTSYFINTQL